MKCTEVKENLDVLLDGEIGFSKRENTLSHLGNCESCKAEFESLQIIGRTMKRTLPITAPAVLDAKVFNAFVDHLARKQTVQSEEKREKVGWFGIPRFAFAGAFVLLALVSVLAFQLGKITASDVQISNLDVAETGKKENALAQNKAAENPAEVKIIEIPVVREKVVKVPVIKEKIVTRTVYVEKKPTTQLRISDRSDSALNNSINEKEFLTQTNLKDFQPVAELKPKILKKEE